MIEIKHNDKVVATTDSKKNAELISETLSVELCSVNFEIDGMIYYYANGSRLAKLRWKK